ncbi:hypothetical protein HK101_010374 [Irineochytrium annulatum]|nr:hypothetical protein HK101_010374 [Irineochytrium annulatum]
MLDKMSTWSDAVTDPDLRRDLACACDSRPTLGALLDRLVTHLVSKAPRAAVAVAGAANAPKSASKSITSIKDPGPRLAVIHDLSFTSPVRKKADLVVCSHAVLLVTPGVASLTDPLAVLPTSILRHIACLPTPNKQKPHYTFCLLTDASAADAAKGQAAVEPILFGLDDCGTLLKVTINEGNSPAKEITHAKPTSKSRELVSLLTRLLPSATMHEPDAKTFTSIKSKPKLPLPYLPCHVRAKESFLYLLPNGVLCGFKKPFMFLPASVMERVEVAGITTRSFSLAMRVKTGGEEEEVEEGEPDLVVEMIERDEYDGVVTYCRKVGIRFGQRDKGVSDEMKRAASARWGGGGRGVINGDGDGDEPAQNGSGDAQQDEDDESEFEGKSEDDNLAEEYDSEHQTDSGSSDDEDGGDGNGSDEEGEDEDGVGEDQEPKRDKRGHFFSERGPAPKRMKQDMGLRGWAKSEAEVVELQSEDEEEVDELE